VRWRPEVSASQRAALEHRFHLTRGEVRDATTWSYELDDQSFVNIRAMVRDASVDDTAYINRRLYRPAFANDRAARIVAGGLMAGAAAALIAWFASRGPISARTVRLDERTVARITGLVPAALIAVTIVVLLLAIVRYEPLWASRDVSLAEAAYHGDIATVFRMVSAGADPGRAEPVAFEHRAAPVVLTPLEAGVESRQVEVVQVLLRAGAKADEPARARLACLAIAVDAPDIGDYLRTTLPPVAQPDCSTIALPEH